MTLRIVAAPASMLSLPRPALPGRAAASVRACATACARARATMRRFASARLPSFPRSTVPSRNNPVSTTRGFRPAC